jgi:hypothetical protein
LTVPGAFFEVTGAVFELPRIMEAINDNDGRLTASSSATLDLWQEMLEEWFKIRDAKARNEALEEAATWILEGVGPDAAAQFRDEKLGKKN